MGQGQRPQSQIRRRVRDAAERKFNRVDRLVHHHVRHVQLQ